MNNMPRYSIDDTIMADPVRKTSMKIKGVTYFDRQKNLKALYNQHLNKEDKHLTLQKFYVGTIQTFSVIFNGLEIGTIPEEHLHLFYSYHYNYELSNIHIDFFKNEYGRDIYWAKLFVIFTPKQKYSRAKIEIVTKNNPKPSVNHMQQSKSNDISKKITRKSDSNSSTGLSEVMVIITCVIMFFLSLAFAFSTSLWYLLVSAFCIVGIVLFSNELTKATSATDVELKVSSRSSVSKAYIAGEYKNTSEEEKYVIEQFRAASDTVREEILMILSLEPIPEKKKQKYKGYSMQEASIILTYRNSSKTIQNTVKQKLHITEIPKGEIKQSLTPKTDLE